MRNIVEVNDRYDPTTSLIYAWDRIRVPIIGLLFRVSVYMCICMSIMLFIERVYMVVVIACLKCLGKRNNNHPVLVQIPLFNEKEVYKLSIGAVVRLSWPSDWLIVEHLDDSTNEVLWAMVELECRKYIQQKGINIKYETRNNRNGYKGGAVREGLKKFYVEDCEVVIIFDADFQPEEDFSLEDYPLPT